MSTAARPAPNQHRTLITTGVLMAVVFPIIGFLIGIALLIKNQVGPGLGVIALCPIGFILGLVLLGA